MEINLISIIFLLLACAQYNYSLKILGLFPYVGKSHYFMYKPYLYELAHRGHEVTIVSHFPDNRTNNPFHINLSNGSKILEDALPVELALISFATIMKHLGVTESCEFLLGSQQVRDLIEKQERFDVIVTELFDSDCSLGVAYQLNAPVVGLTSGSLMPHLNKRFGIPDNPAYCSFHFGHGGSKPNYFQRLESFIYGLYSDFVTKKRLRREQVLFEKYYPDTPELDGLTKNVKFLLVNHYFTLRGTTLNPSNVIEIAGIHLSKPQPLPKDIAEFIDSAEHGVVFVCFGSLVKMSTIPKEKLDIFLSALGELPQKVILKWEGDKPPHSSKLMAKKWLPQVDILAHPNVKAFVSHGGMMGMIEAASFGVPVVTIPIVGDQPSNAAFVRERGLGVTLHYSKLSKESLLAALKTVMSEKFQEQTRELSEMFNNRPVSAMDVAIFWTEFTAKHPNISFTSPSATVPTYQYYLFDIYGTFVAVFFLLLLCINLCYRRYKKILLQTNCYSKSIKLK